jgi:uncharacterized glyoxalase superfamily protein PhnB
MFTMPKLDAVGIIVSALEPARRFYALLGLEFPEDEGHTEAVTETGLRVMLDTEELVRSFDPGWVRPTGQRVGLAFLCNSPAEVDSLYAKVVATGFRGHKEPWDAFWGQRYAQVADPNGNIVDLFAAL